eukprot:1127415-Rhodomonas_salina.2
MSVLLLVCRYASGTPHDTSSNTASVLSLVCRYAYAPCQYYPWAVCTLAVCKYPGISEEFAAAFPAPGVCSSLPSTEKSYFEYKLDGECGFLYLSLQCTRSDSGDAAARHPCSSPASLYPPVILSPLHRNLNAPSATIHDLSTGQRVGSA